MGVRLGQALVSIAAGYFLAEYGWKLFFAIIGVVPLALAAFLGMPSSRSGNIAGVRQRRQQRQQGLHRLRLPRAFTSFEIARFSEFSWDSSPTTMSGTSI